MKYKIPFCAYTGKEPLEVEISDDTETWFQMRAAVFVAVSYGIDLSGVSLRNADLRGRVLW